MGKNSQRSVKLRTIFVLLVFVFFSKNVSYSQSYTWDDLVTKLTTDEDSEYESWKNFYDDLCEIHDNPYNINTITKEQLETLPFLSPQLVENILYYQYQYGPMKSMGELQLIEEMDYETRHLLTLFVYIGKPEKKSSIPKLKNILKYGKQEIITRLDIPFYKKAGYQEYSDSVLARYPNRKYMGNSLHHSLRYSFHYGTKVFLGITAEKDAGEPLFCKGNNSYDYISAYVMLKNIGRLNTFILGNYRLNYGQGLVMNTDFSLGKTAILSTMGTGKGIKKHSSTSETGYFKGIALSYKVGKTDISVFYSYNDQDANLNDSLLITSFKTDGYHRTPLEMTKKNNITDELIGTHFDYSLKGLHLGATCVYNCFNTRLKESDKLYKLYSAKGNNFYTTGIDYTYYCHRFSFYGETALNKGGGIATVNSFHLNISEYNKLILLYRNYSKKYNALFANAFSEGGSVQNEEGLYLGLDMGLSKTLKGKLYVDFFRSPWLKYQVSAPSKGIDILSQLNWTPNKMINVFVKYRFKSKEKDVKDENKNWLGLANNLQHRFQGQLNTTISSLLSFRTNFYYNRNIFLNADKDSGYLISQQMMWKPIKDICTIDAGISYFNTDSYDSRVYTYEKGLLYAFSFMSFYGEGMRFNCCIRFDFSKNLMFMAKYGHTKYFDRNSIGSNQEEINSSLKNDLYLQLRYKF